MLATDGAEAMLEVARQHDDGEGNGRDGEKGQGIRFRRVDVTSDEQLNRLVEDEGRFDVILINMAIMDVATLEPLARALPKLLAEGGV